MNDQIGMGVGHCRQHIQKEADARLHVELMLVAILIDRFAVNIFEDEIRLAIGGNAGIEEFGNMRMREPTKDAAFAFESFFRRAPGQRDVHELYRSLSLEPAVTTAGEAGVCPLPAANLIAE